MAYRKFGFKTLGIYSQPPVWTTRNFYRGLLPLGAAIQFLNNPIVMEHASSGLRWDRSSSSDRAGIYTTVGTDPNFLEAHNPPQGALHQLS